MATKLINSVTRELLGTKTNDKYRHRAVVITLEAGDIATFRIKGTRQTYSVPLAFCLKLAQITDAAKRYKDQLLEYKAKVKAGFKRLRRPKRQEIPYGSIFFDATKVKWIAE